MYVLLNMRLIGAHFLGINERFQYLTQLSIKRFEFIADAIGREPVCLPWQSCHYLEITRLGRSPVAWNALVNARFDSLGYITAQKGHPFACDFQRPALSADLNCHLFKGPCPCNDWRKVKTISLVELA